MTYDYEIYMREKQLHEYRTKIVARTSTHRTLFERLSTAARAGVDVRLLRNKLTKEGLTSEEIELALSRCRKAGY